MRKKLRCIFYLLAFLENTCFVCISMGNGPVEGAITCTVKHKKVYFSKTHPNLFSDFFAENVRLLFLNIIKLIPLGPQPQSIKSRLSPYDNRRVKWQHENENK